jgi:carbon-monoxide dehydrogenase large subunit
VAIPGEGAVGRAVPRREDVNLLTGRGTFVDDLLVDGALEAVFLRSPVSHARLERVDAAAARASPGVAAVYSAAELGLPPLVSPCETPNSYSPPRPLLAEGVVRFVGEPIAVVVAGSRYDAEDAADLIEVELEPLTPVPDAEQALAEEAPSVHGDRPNLYLESSLDAGAVDVALARAAAVV